MGRYFGDDFYIVGVKSIDTDDHDIVCNCTYGYGDEEIMDIGQVEYAYSLFLDECT